MSWRGGIGDKVFYIIFIVSALNRDHKPMQDEKALLMRSIQIWNCAIYGENTVNYRTVAKLESSDPFSDGNNDPPRVVT